MKIIQINKLLWFVIIAVVWGIALVGVLDMSYTERIAESLLIGLKLEGFIYDYNEQNEWLVQGKAIGVVINSLFVILSLLSLISGLLTNLADKIVNDTKRIDHVVWGVIGLFDVFVLLNINWPAFYVVHRSDHIHPLIIFLSLSYYYACKLIRRVTYEILARQRQ